MFVSKGVETMKCLFDAARVTTTVALVLQARATRLTIFGALVFLVLFSTGHMMTPAYAQGPAADLVIDNVGPAVVPAGGQATFQFYIENVGTANAGTVRVKETFTGIDAATCNISYSPPDAGSARVGNVITMQWLTLTLAPGEYAWATIRCTGVPGAAITKTGEADPGNFVAESDETNNSDANLANNAAIPAAASTKAVGGIAELVDADAALLETAGSSGAGVAVLAGLVAGAIAVAVLALGGAAWYARRRRVVS